LKTISNPRGVSRSNASQSAPWYFGKWREYWHRKWPSVAGIFILATKVVHENELRDQTISLDFFLFPPAEIRQGVEAAGLVIEEIIDREPYTAEVDTRVEERTSLPN
jgi:hypothetical protein